MAAHTQTAHRVMGADLRRMAGYNSKQSICSAEDSEASREHLLSMDDREDITRRGAAAATAVGAPALAREAAVRKVLAENKAKYDGIVALFRAGVLMQDIAAEVGMDRDSVSSALRRAGVVSGPARSVRYANAEYATRFRQVTRDAQRAKADATLGSPEHGTRRMYDRENCRCDECRAAVRDRARARRSRR